MLSNWKLPGRPTTRQAGASAEDQALAHLLKAGLMGSNPAGLYVPEAE